MSFPACSSRRRALRLALGAAAAGLAGSAAAHGWATRPALPAPAELAWTGALSPSARQAQDLRFAELFERPVGPAGLRPTRRVLALAGQRVRMVGYLASAAVPVPGRAILAPLPVQLGDADDHLADDLPPQAVHLHLGGAAATRSPPDWQGALVLEGRLEVGALEEPDGRLSWLRLLLDEDTSLRLAPSVLPPALVGGPAFR